MPIHIVHRPFVATDAAGLDAALTRLRAGEEEPRALRARWQHSYVLRRTDGRIGLLCLFEAEAVATLRRHAERTALPAGEILPVAATLHGRPFAPTRVWLVRRRAACSGLAALKPLAAAARRIADEEMPAWLSWLTSHAVRESDGSLGLVCLYQAVDAQALQEHARRAGLPADEITAVLGRVDFHAGTAASPFVRPIHQEPRP